MPNPRIEALMRKHAARLAATYRELAMNFECPAHDIIAMACADMRITESQYRAIQDYRFQQEQAQ